MNKNELSSHRFQIENEAIIYLYHIKVDKQLMVYLIIYTNDESFTKDLTLNRKNALPQDFADFDSMNHAFL